MPKVFILGSINQDIVGFCPRYPKPGETVFGSRLERFPGGKGANQAVAAALAGATTSIVGAVGRDPAGSELLAFLKSKGVDVSLVQLLDGFSTGTALILVEPSGQNSIIVIPGANNQVEVNAVEAARLLAAGDVCLSQFEVPIASVTSMFSAAKAGQAHTILNPSPFQSIPHNLMEQTDILIVNETEYSALIGREALNSFALLESDLKNRPQVGRQADIVTAGEAGLFLKTDAACIHIPGHAVQAIDTTGAGDCFAGAFAALIAKGAPPLKAAEFANAAAAISVTRPGAGSSMPTQDEVNALLYSTRNVGGA